jgi:hypothetical protein
MHTSTRLFPSLFLSLICVILLAACGEYDPALIEADPTLSESPANINAQCDNFSRSMMNAQCRGPVATPTPTPIPLTVEAITDYIYCTPDGCLPQDPTPEYEQAGPGGFNHMLYQKREMVTVGEDVVTDIWREAGGTIPSTYPGWEWIGSSCGLLNCYHLYTKTEAFAGQDVIVNAKYCVLDYWDFVYYCSAPDPLFDPSGVYRVGGESVIILGPPDLVHDLHAEKTLPPPFTPSLPSGQGMSEKATCADVPALF